YRKDVARVVMEFKEKSGYVITEEPDGLSIVIPTGSVARTAETRPTPPAPVTLSAAIVKTPETASAPTPERSDALPATPTVPPPPPAATPTPAPPPTSTAGRLISLDFKDADVVNLLRILAAESGKNVVISDDVKGKMSITLRNVPWEQALDIIMEARGLEKVERDNVLRIVSADQLARERDQRTKLEE